VSLHVFPNSLQCCRRDVLRQSVPKSRIEQQLDKLSRRSLKGWCISQMTTDDNEAERRCRRVSTSNDRRNQL